MMNMTRRFLLPLVTVLMTGSVLGQAPNLGYLYPAGGKQGRTVEVLAGGQRLNGVKQAHVTGEGVTVEVVKHYRLVRNVNGDQRKLLTKLLQERENELLGENKPAAKKKASPYRKPAAKKVPPKKSPKTKTIATEKTDAKKAADKKTDPKKTEEKKEVPPIKLPPHPLLESIDQMSLRELEVVRRTFLKANRNQLNPQLGELVTLQVNIAAGAAPGDRMIRLVTPSGLTNPVCFQVGLLPEASEQEPNNPGEFTKLPPVKPLKLPVTVNGQIMPGDIDRIPFHAKKGEPLVVDAEARSLIPYLADAVPGWFQIVVALLDEKGKEVAYADDFRFDPDPVMRFDIPKDGLYHLEVRDSIYRGREDFVYRIRLGRVPVITEMFPLGTQQGKISTAQVRGWNLPAGVVKFDSGGDAGPLRETSLTKGPWHTNSVPYAVHALPQMRDREPNDGAKTPQRVKLPKMIDGRIAKAGDVDVFRIDGREGQEIVAEVQARTLNSPLDSKLTLLDGRGAVVAKNDDFMEKDGHLHLGAGLLTHHADSYLRIKLPADGPYFIVLADSQGHGGSAYAYRLRLSEPDPGFRVMVSPSTMLAPAGEHAPLRFHIARCDGFNGPVEISLVDAPSGYRLHGATIPAGQDQIRATLESPVKKPVDPVELHFLARSLLGDHDLECKVQPADNRMQAFLWRHLVPADAFIVMPRWGRRYELSLEIDGPVLLTPGASVDVRVLAREGSLPMSMRINASDPPAGITVKSSGMLSDGFVLTLQADQSLKPGPAGNLIVEGWMQPAARKGKRAPRPQLMGVLPPIPFVTEPPK